MFASAIRQSRPDIEGWAEVQADRVWPVVHWQTAEGAELMIMKPEMFEA
jgi:hypothetical protein